MRSERFEDVPGVRCLRSAAPIGRQPVGPVSSALLDRDHVRSPLEGVDVVIHCTAGDAASTVDSTRNMLPAAQSTGVQRLVHVGTIDGFATPTGFVTRVQPIARSRNGPSPRESPAAVDAETDPSRALSVAHVCVPAPVGGLESVVLGLSRGLAERGHDVTLVAIVREESAAASLFGPLAGSAVKTVAVKASNRAYLQEIRAVAGILDSLRPQVLHTHGYRSDILHAPIARRQGIATVSTLHGFDKSGLLTTAVYFVHGRVMRRFDGVVAVSRPLVDFLSDRGVPRGRVHYIRNAWSPLTAPIARGEARRVLGLPDDETRVIGWVGRLSPVKGADVFLRSLSGLTDASHVACIVGDGPERPALEGLARDLGIEDRLRWAGTVPDAGGLFSAFDVLVLSSRSEGTPMVLIEAMGQGVPVVATRVGGVPELIDGHDEAWLVPPEAPDLLANALRECLSDPVEAEARAQRARARVGRELDTVSWIRLHEQAYEAAIEIRRRG